MNRLKEFRGKKGKTQYDVARAANIQPQKVSEYECGRRDLRLQEAMKIATFLNISLDELADFKRL